MATLFNGAEKHETFLIHCRPRLIFHLGHLSMLNHMHKILSDGHKVIILIIPYDEHQRNNLTVKSRLLEDIELTKAFYQNYLGFTTPDLTILSTYDLDISDSELSKVQSVYQRLYKQESGNIKRLIDENNRQWASPNITFVAKCIVSILSQKPDCLICGAKHEHISDSFQTILDQISPGIKSYKFENFKDLLMNDAMDSTDSVHSVIEVNDNSDFVSQKLFSLKNASIKSAWLEHFITQIFEKAPTRVKEGINFVQRTEGEIEITLSKFLANVRLLIPYANSEGKTTNNLEIHWSDGIKDLISGYQKSRIERIARSAYVGKSLLKILFQRVFTSGKSGSYVFEIREFEHTTPEIISNVSILKIGNYDELIYEYDCYNEFIKQRKTHAFLEITNKSISIEGYLGILYQDAHHYLGIARGERIYTIERLLLPSLLASASEFKKSFSSLFNSHLNEVFYKHGRFIERAPVKSFYNELLPAEYIISVDHYDSSEGLHFKSDSTGAVTFFKGRVKITEINFRDKRARGYTLDYHTKVDLLLGDDEILINSLYKEMEVDVSGIILSGRLDFYIDLLKKIEVIDNGPSLVIDDNLTISNTITKINDVLSVEHSNFSVSQVHGDLHCGNILYGNNNFGIIDYGKVRSKFVSFYDLAYIIADLKIKHLSVSLSIQDIFDIENLIYKDRFMMFNRLRYKQLALFEVFEYNNLPQSMIVKGDKRLFYSCLMLTFLGMLKFDLDPQQKKAALIFSHFSYLKTLR